MKNRGVRIGNNMLLKSSKAFTLIEVVVVIVILSIVSVITINFLINSLKIYTMTVNQKTLFDEGKLALERMCRDIRDGRSITSPASGGSGSSITFIRNNATAQDVAAENITFCLTGTTLEKVKASPVATSSLASNVSTFTVTRGAAGNDEITLVLTLSLASGENVTLQTKVYPKNLTESTTYKNFRIQDSSGTFASWQEVSS
ncbi:MAG: prepilin-type N-terminal cleavage/methylation domain-containing protein [Nitrospirota bacterium]